MCVITIMSDKEINSSKVIEFNAGRRYAKPSIGKIYKIKFTLQDYPLAYSKIEYTYTISKMSLLELNILYKICILI